MIMPRLTMTNTLLVLPHPRPRMRLLLRQASQHSKNNRTPSVQLHLHQPMRHRIRNIFKMHRAPLNQHSNRYYRIKRPRRRLGRRAALSRATRRKQLRRTAKEICGCGNERRRCVDGGGGVHALGGVRELVAAGHGLNDDVFAGDAEGLDGVDGAVEEGAYYWGIPAAVEDADAEGRGLGGWLVGGVSAVFGEGECFVEGWDVEYHRMMERRRGLCAP